MEDAMSIRENIDKVLVTEEQIRVRSKELGEQITKDYAKENKAPLLVALLRGSVPFLAELIKHIDLDIQYDFMDVTSYEGTRSTGDIKILKDLDTSIVGKDILLVEDIVDTGRTVQAVKGMLANKGAASVKIVTLLDKPSKRICDVNADYVGFEIDDYFVVGFGLDYDQRYRALPFVGVLKADQY
jgi:hypoxanthine phosphoribosyltransferase